MTVPFNTASGSASISTSEYSLLDSTTTGVPVAHSTPMRISGVIDVVANMVAGDQYRFRVYEKASGGTARPIWEETRSGAQAYAVAFGPFDVSEGYDVTALRQAGSDRTILWSIKEMIGDVNVATVTANAITATAIADGAIDAATFAAGAINAAAIASDAITAAKVADGAIDAATFAAGAINAAAIASDAITAAKVADGAIDAATFAAGAINAAAIADGAITAAKVADGAIDAATFAAGAINAAAIADGAIDAATFAAGAINAAAIASDAITAAKVADAAIDAATFAAGAINASAIADGAIDAATFAADVDVYQAKVWLVDDNSGASDRYVAVWYRNGAPIVAGITSPAIQVIKASDGTDLVASVSMTEIGSLGLYTYVESSNRIADGAAYVAKVTATIAAVTRTWYQPVSRDS